MNDQRESQPSIATMKLKNPIVEGVWSLEVQDIHGGVRRVTVDANPIVIGSGRGAGVTIADPTVSKAHCEVVVKDRALLVRDLGSCNGTYVGGARIQVAHAGCGTVITVGQSTRFLRLKGITRATGYGISVWDVTILGSKDASCSADNLLTRGWDPNSVQDVACPGGSGCGTTYSLDATRPNFINFSGGFFCPVSSGSGSSLTFTQAVTSPLIE